MYKSDDYEALTKILCVIVVVQFILVSYIISTQVYIPFRCTIGNVTHRQCLNNKLIDRYVFTATTTITVNSASLVNGVNIVNIKCIDKTDCSYCGTIYKHGYNTTCYSYINGIYIQSGENYSSLYITVVAGVFVVISAILLIYITCKSRDRVYILQQTV